MSCPYSGSPPGGLIEECHYFNQAGQASEDVRSSDSYDQTFGYDTNGNRSQDERGQHQYNALDQEVLWTRGGPNTTDPGGTSSYTLDGNGQLLQELDNLSYSNVAETIGGVSASVSENEQITTRHCSNATAASTPPANAQAAASAPMCSTDAGRVENVQTTATVTGTVTSGGVSTPISAPSQTTTQLDCYDPLPPCQAMAEASKTV